MKRWLLPAIAIAGLGAGGICLFSRPRPDPALQLMGTALPDWQTERARPGSAAVGPAARELFVRAKRWPALATAFEVLDHVWPDEIPVRDAARSVNRALADAGLPYFVDVWPVNDRPIVLSYDLLGRAPWRIGARTVDVLRLRRLDRLNIELGLYGVTEEGLPVVMLDRVEATLARDLPAMYGKSADQRSATLNDFDRLALDRVRALLETRLGSAVAAAAAALGERDRLLEQMRSRFHGGQVQLDPPDGFVLGDAWLAGLEPETQLTRPGGPLILDTDLRDVTRADAKLREGALAPLLAAAVDLMASSTEAHEARHALDEIDPVGPPPPALFEIMPGSSTPMIGMADKELRAYLGELHDAALPACVTLAEVMRNVYGRGARRNPHFFATLTILRQLNPESDLQPAEQLSMSCGVPDAELRRRLAAAWQKLYDAPMPPGRRATDS